MSGLSRVISVFTHVVDKIPFERLLSRPPDNTKKLQELRTILGGSMTQPRAATPTPAAYEGPALPTGEETSGVLKRRLAKELYRAELDLSGGLRISGKPCDCLDTKHTLGLEATAEELIAQEPDNPVYTEIIQWIQTNRPKLTIASIVSGQFDGEYPRMAAQFKSFRKTIMGTTSLIMMTEEEPPLTLEEAKRLASNEAEREVEKRWQSKETKPER